MIVAGAEGRTVKGFAREDKAMEATDHVFDRIKGCLIGGAVGDALGFPIEFLDEEALFRLYGEDGVTDYELSAGVALFSDDTQMTMFTADGIIVAEREYGEPTEEQIVKSVYESYLGWLSTQDSQYPLPEGVRRSALLRHRRLYSRRGPGQTCLSALSSGVCGSFKRKLNNSKGCGGVMRIAPVALALSQKNASREEICSLAARVAAITHSHRLGYIPASFAALLIDGFLREEEPLTAAEHALSDTKAFFPAWEETEYFCSLIEKAVSLACNEYGQDDLDAIHELGLGWVAEETVAIALYCTLRHTNDFKQAVIAAVNHGGDSDSTGAVAGNFIGALVGYGAIPQELTEALELKDVILELAEELVR